MFSAVRGGKAAETAGVSEPRTLLQERLMEEEETVGALEGSGRSEREICRRRKLLGAGGRPGVRLNTAGSHRGFLHEQQGWRPSVIHQKPERLYVKEEAEEPCLKEADIIAVTVKTEEVEEEVNPESAPLQKSLCENRQEPARTSGRAGALKPGSQYPCEVRQWLTIKETFPREQRDWSSSEDQEEPESCRFKKEVEDLWVKQEANIIVKTEDEEEEEESEFSQFDYREAAKNSSREGHLRLDPPDQNSSDTEDSEDDQKETIVSPILRMIKNKMVTVIVSNDTGSDTNLAVKPFGCAQCGKRFTQKCNLKQHEKIHTGEKPFSCLVCGKQFCLKSNLTKHKIIHTGEKPFSCSDCGKKFFLKSNLTKHKVIHTRAKNFSCTICGKIFVKKSNLNSHEQTHTNERPYGCSDCGKRFVKRTQLRKHEKYHSIEKPFNCTQCGKGFTEKCSLKSHEKVHTGEKPFICIHCGKGFTEKSSLKSHEKIHTGEKPYSCLICGKSFIKRSNLSSHEKIHTGEKPFSCSECGKRFIKKSNLRIHEKTHTGLKPFSCLVCGKRFIEKSYLMSHEKTHTGEKPFSCTECGKRFIKKGNLKSHEKIHVGEKPFSCSECGKSFIRKHHLTKHIIVHTKEKLSLPRNGTEDCVGQESAKNIDQATEDEMILDLRTRDQLTDSIKQEVMNKNDIWFHQ